LETPLPQLTRKKKNERGQTLVELALVLPILVGVVLAIAQFGVAFNNYITLTDAARAAARKGAVSRNSSTPQADCQNAGYAAGGNLKSPGTTFVVSCSSSWGIGSDVTVTATYPWQLSIMGWVVKSGTLSTTMKERVE
jgi:Flp pilus assembly protein TadG